MSKEAFSQNWLSVLFSGIVLAYAPREASPSLSDEAELAPPQTHPGTTILVNDTESIVEFEQRERDFILNKLRISLKVMAEIEKSRCIAMICLKHIEKREPSPEHRIAVEKHRVILDHRDRMQKLIGTENVGRLVEFSLHSLTASKLTEASEAA